MCRMKSFYVVLVVTIFVAAHHAAEASNSCYFNCMRELIRCNRSGRDGCCDHFKNVCAKGCDIFDAKCRDSKRGSWNKRFYPSEYPDELEEEYFPYLRK